MVNAGTVFPMVMAVMKPILAERTLARLQVFDYDYEEWLVQHVGGESLRRLSLLRNRAAGYTTQRSIDTDGSGNLDDIVISAGATTGTVTFDPTDDSVYEGDETATISINGVTGKTGVAENSTPQSVTITISENESSPTVTLTSSASSIAENSGSTITLTATISQAADEDVTVNLGAAGTSTNGTDYGSLSSITVSAGDTTGTATFDPTDDSVYEGNETAVISISSVSGADAAESGSQSVTITITENESSPTITLTSSASSIAENAGSSLTLTATSSIVALPHLLQ